MGLDEIGTYDFVESVNTKSRLAHYVNQGCVLSDKAQSIEHHRRHFIARRKNESLEISNKMVLYP